MHQSFLKHFFSNRCISCNPIINLFIIIHRSAPLLALFSLSLVQVDVNLWLKSFGGRFAHFLEMNCFRVNGNWELLTSYKTLHPLRSALINWWSYPGQSFPATLRGRHRTSCLVSAALSHRCHVAASPIALRRPYSHRLHLNHTRIVRFWNIPAVPMTTRQLRGCSWRTPVLRWNATRILRNVAHRNLICVCLVAH